MTEVVGIDLGATYSVVAHLDADGNPEVIPDEAGELLVPTVISFAATPPSVGTVAKSAQADGDTTVAAAFKSHLGDPRFQLSFDGNDFDATDLCVLLLAKLKAQAETFTGNPVTHAVITVPAHFTHPQRAATMVAARRAGLDVLRLVSEPTAAAVAFGLRAAREPRTVVVYDLGGGTFDVSVVRMTAKSIQVLGADGDHLGGRDWDDRIATHVHEMFAQEFGVDIGADDAPVLLARAEQLKHTLSVRQRGDIQLDFGGHAARYQLSRETFDDLTRDLVDRTELLTARVIAGAGLGWSQIDGVIAIGGSTRMPMVRERIVAMSGRPPLAGVHPDQAVAIGAAIDAATAAVRAPSVQDVTAHSLGVIVEDADRSRSVNKVLISKNVPIPAREIRPCPFRLRDTGKNLFEIFLTQSETDEPRNCVYLGRYVITGFGPGSGDTVVDIEYAYDRSGLVHVAATDRTTTRPLLVTVDDLPPDVPARFARRPAPAN